MIVDRKTGWLFKAGDVEDLARTVLELLGKRELWSAITQAGRKFVEQERTWQASTRPYAALYEKLARKTL